LKVVVIKSNELKGYGSKYRALIYSKPNNFSDFPALVNSSKKYYMTFLSLHNVSKSDEMLENFYITNDLLGTTIPTK